jgi:fumarate reductase subunit C
MCWKRSVWLFGRNWIKNRRQYILRHKESVSALWFAAALIFIYGYARKKRQANRRLKEMEAEEESEE